MMKTSLMRRIQSLEDKFVVPKNWPLIREVVNNCPDERSRRAALALASEAGILDIRWVGEGTRTTRTLPDVVDDVDALVGEEQSRLAVELQTPDFRFWDLGICILLSIVLDLERSDHVETLGEVEEMVKGLRMEDRG